MPTPPPLPPRSSPPVASAGAGATSGLLSPPAASPSATSPFSSSPLASSPLAASPSSSSDSTASYTLSPSSSRPDTPALPFPASTHPSIQRFHTYLNEVYTPHELAARLSSPVPARSDDVHVLHCAAAHANLWVVLDRGFQAAIRQRGVDFCTLTAAVHFILSNLPPYDYIDASPDEEDAQPALASVPDGARGGAGVPTFTDPRPGMRGQVLSALERTTRSGGKRSSQLMHRLGGRVGDALALKDRPPAHVPSLSAPAPSRPRIARTGSWRVSLVPEKRMVPPPLAYDAPAGPVLPVLPRRPPPKTAASTSTSTPSRPSPSISISPAPDSASAAHPARPLPPRRQTAPTHTPARLPPTPSPGLGASISERFRAMSGTPYTDSLPSPGLPGKNASRSPFSLSPNRKSPSSASASASGGRASPSPSPSGSRKSSPAKSPSKSPKPFLGAPRPKSARTNTAPTPGRLSVPHLSVPHVSLKSFKLGARKNGDGDAPPRSARTPQRM